MKLVCILHQPVNVLILGHRIAFHSFTDDLDITAAASQDITQRPF